MSPMVQLLTVDSVLHPGVMVSTYHLQKINVSNNEMCRNKLSGIYCVDSENISINNNLTEGNDEDGINIDALYRGCNTVEYRATSHRIIVERESESIALLH